MGSKDTGGMSAYILGLAQALSAMGHSVDIFSAAARHTGPVVQPLFKNVRLVFLKERAGALKKENYALGAGSLAKEILCFSETSGSCYDFIFSHYWVSGVVGEVLKKSIKRPHLMMFHTLGQAKNDSGAKEAEPLIRIKTEEELTKICDLVVATSTFEAKLLKNYYALPASRLKVIGAGVDRLLFRPGEKLAARQKLGLAEEEKIVLATGRLEPVKGFNLLTEAFSMLPAGQNFKLVIIGGEEEDEEDWASREALRKEAQALGVKERLTFAGRVEHTKMPLYYQAADVVAVPSYFESFSMVALEALSCGTPLVMAPVGVALELAKIKGSNLALKIVDDYQAAPWAAALKEAACLKPLTLKITAPLLAPYSWPKVAGRLAKGIEELV